MLYAFPSRLYYLYISVFYFPHLGFVAVYSEQCGQVLAVGVGDEYLSELLPYHQLYDSLHAFAIQFVEYIIEQKDWLLVEHLLVAEV